ncbi:thiamine ABC transporter substrate binding subunit [Tatumella citrea]|uniref:Thiamine-binding periplasmic protein n=1 Tax=Tatumella citrea TaxID=53336 RepID=A0A1Y0LBM3_TATCI|nr:thiamine ABC transporter substrate binding subunit [Tatumella citrea]ARU95165.1 thiamine ABC transporter substrate binding subunit [Tatumella citrea]ARU99205.1 thiamine ABC transporter substrate binding subunit [Tatumella citrea]
MLKKVLPVLLLISAPVLAAKPELTVYTYDSFSSDWGPGPAIKKAFETNCNCTLKYVSLGDGVALLNRLRMEGKHSKADVVVGLDNNLLDAAQKTGLFAPTPVDYSHLTVPGGWNNTTFVPYDYGYFAFVYNKKLLKNPPTSLKQLVESPEKWRVIYEDPRTSTPGLGLLLWMQKVYGDQAPAAWQKLAAKTVTVTRGWSEAYSLFLKGESDLVLSYTTSPAYHIIEEHNSDYAAANFPEGNYMQVEVAARLKDSPHPALAKQFMQFVTSPAFQQTLPTGNWMYPVIKTTLPAGYQQLTVPKTALQFTPEEVATHRDAWISAWQNAVSH